MSRMQDEGDRRSMFALIVSPLCKSVCHSLNGGLTKAAKLKLCLKALSAVHSAAFRSVADGSNLFDTSGMLQAMQRFAVEHEAELTQVKSAMVSNARALGILEQRFHRQTSRYPQDETISMPAEGFSPHPNTSLTVERIQSAPTGA